MFKFNKHCSFLYSPVQYLNYIFYTNFVNSKISMDMSKNFATRIIFEAVGSHFWFSQNKIIPLLTFNSFANCGWFSPFSFLSDEFLNNGFSSQYYTLSNQQSAKQKQKNKLEQKVWSIEHNKSYIGLWIGSGLVFVVTAGAVATLYVYAYRRNILAYGVQSTMPIVQEGLETMAPTIGKVSEEIAKGISNGKSKNKK